MKVKTYCPYETKISINGTQITGLADEYLCDANQRQFTLKLHVASDSVEYIKSLTKNQHNPVVRVDIYVDLSEQGVHIDVFDIKGEYILVDQSYNLSTDFPLYQFKFFKLIEKLDLK